MDSYRNYPKDTEDTGQVRAIPACSRARSTAFAIDGMHTMQLAKQVWTYACMHLYNMCIA